MLAKRNLSGAALTLAIASTLALGGCVTAPGPTTVNLTMTGAATMNGTAPAKVKVYYLASSAAFRAADFFPVFNTPQAALGSDLLAVDEFLLAPGRTLTNSRRLATPPAAIGVVAGFRDIDHARFKDIRPLTPNATNTVRVTVSGNAVSIGNPAQE